MSRPQPRTLITYNRPPPSSSDLDSIYASYNNPMPLETTDHQCHPQDQHQGHINGHDRGLAERGLYISGVDKVGNSDGVQGMNGDQTGSGRNQSPRLYTSKIQDHPSLSRALQPDEKSSHFDSMTPTPYPYNGASWRGEATSRGGGGGVEPEIAPSPSLNHSRISRFSSNSSHPINPPSQSLPLSQSHSESISRHHNTGYPHPSTFDQEKFDLSLKSSDSGLPLNPNPTSGADWPTRDSNHKILARAADIDIHRPGWTRPDSKVDQERGTGKDDDGAGGPTSPSLIGGLAPTLGYDQKRPRNGTGRNSWLGSGSGGAVGGGRGSGSRGAGVGGRNRRGGRGSDGAGEILVGWKKYLPHSISTRLFLLTVLLETIVDVGIEADLLFRFNVASNSMANWDAENVNLVQNQRILPVYLTMFGLAHIWQLVLAIDAIAHRNTIQIIALSIFNSLLLTYSIMQVTELQTILGNTSVANGTTEGLLKVPIAVLTDGLIGVVCVAEAGFLVLTYFVYRDFGWAVWHRLGADPKIRVYFLHYQIFTTIIRFSYLFFLGFGIQFIFLVLEINHDIEFWLTILALPTSLMMLFLGTLSADHEWVWGMSIFMVSQFPGMGYFVYKILRIWQQRSGVYAQIYKTMLVFAVISAIMLLLTFVWSCIVLSQFNKGLKRQRYNYKAKQKALKQSALATQNGSVTPGTPQFELENAKNRMSID